MERAGDFLRKHHQELFVSKQRLDQADCVRNGQTEAGGPVPDPGLCLPTVRLVRPAGEAAARRHPDP
jgi:hypothetical protein